MNEIVANKINNGEYEDALVELLVVFKTLNSFAKAGYDCESKEEMIALIDKFAKYKNENDIVWEFPFILDSVMSHLIHLEHSFLDSEFALHKKFEDNILNLIPGGKIVKRKDHKSHRPDFWVSVDNIDYPVEIKLKKFDNKAQKQLLRYMWFYKCSLGFAVAPVLTSKLPNNITFIELGV